MSFLDQSIIEEVRETLGDDAYRGFVERMLSEAATTTAELAALLEKGDVAGIAQLAHRSAGSAVSVGASGLHASLKAIEDEARSVTPHRLAELIGTLPATVAQTRSGLLALLG